MVRISKSSTQMFSIADMTTYRHGRNQFVHTHVPVSDLINAL